MKNESTGYSVSEIEDFVAKMYPNHEVIITPYAYSTTFLNLAQGAAASNVININANADFVMLGAHHRAALAVTQTAASKTAPFVRMMLTDSGSGENFTSVPVDLECYSTNGNIVNSLPYPRIINGRTSLTVSVTNFAPLAETYTTLDVVLEGIQVRAYTKIS